MKKIIAIAIIIASFALSYLGHRVLNDASPEQNDVAPPNYHRIISLAPSITEDLYALGLGNRVIGVTNFCTYPADAITKPSVGGIIDTNYEAILHLQPDLVVLMPAHVEAQSRLQELGIQTLTIDHRTLPGILNSIEAIGDACQVSERADALLASIHERLDTVRARTEGLDRPTVLISAGRSKDSDTIREVYAAGRGQWYDELITIAGGENVFTEQGMPFPSVTGEALVRLNPEIIVEMAPTAHSRGISPEKIIAQWDSLSEIEAVRNGRVHVLDGDYTTIPGPRIVRIVEDLALALHPEVDWGTHE